MYVCMYICMEAYVYGWWKDCEFYNMLGDT